MREWKWGKDAVKKKNAFLIREKEITQKKTVLPFNNFEVNLFSFSSAYAMWTFSGIWSMYRSNSIKM